MTAEERLNKLANCSCDEAYRLRDLTDPNCFYCEWGEDIIRIMQEHGEQEYNQALEDVNKKVISMCDANEYIGISFKNTLVDSINKLKK